MFQKTIGNDSDSKRHLVSFSKCVLIGIAARQLRVIGFDDI